MNFPFFDKVVKDIQQENPCCDICKCEQLAIISLFNHWKESASEEYANVSLYLYFTKLFKYKPNLKKLADDNSTMWNSSHVCKEIGFISTVRNSTDPLDRINNLLAGIERAMDRAIAVSQELQ